MAHVSVPRWISFSNVSPLVAVPKCTHLCTKFQGGLTKTITFVYKVVLRTKEGQNYYVEIIYK